MRKYKLLILLAVLLAALLAGNVVMAAEPDGEVEPAGPITTYDDGVLEVGIEYVVDYPPSGPGGDSMPVAGAAALALRNQLIDTCRVSLFGICILGWPTPTWTPRFVYGNSLAWEEDWKRYAAGGTEHYYVDTVDLAYFTGESWNGGLIFGVGGNTHDDPYLTYSDAYQAWGNWDADWIGLAACFVLADAHLGDWANTMHGLRLILGFKTGTVDAPHGDWFGYYLRLGYNMTAAWFAAADRLQPQGVVARVLAEESWMFYDTWAAHDDQDYYDNTYHWWTHAVGSEPARYVDASQLQEVPIYQLTPFSLDDANERWETLGTAFAVTTTDYVTGTVSAVSLGGLGSTLQEPDIRTSANNQMQMDVSNGLYSYVETDSLWAPSQTEAAAVQAISQDQARQIADQFLNQNGLMPGDAQYFEVAADIMAQAENQPEGSAAGVSQAISETTTAYQVIYSRIISYTPPSAAGTNQGPIEFSVMGPGSKLKVYVATTVPGGVSGASLLQEAVIGGVGGYRAVQQATAAGTNELLTTQVLPLTTVEKLVDINTQGEPELESRVALSYTPLPTIAEREIVTSTLAYWEGAMGWSQAELVPVYAVELRNILAQDQTVVTTTAYIPANPRYMAPLAIIDSATLANGNAIPAYVQQGTALKLDALDAKTPLNLAGYDQSLNFPLGYVNVDPDATILYNWYLNEVSQENLVGTGPTFNYTVDLPAVQSLHGATAMTIILEVIDAEGGGVDGVTSLDRFQFNVLPYTYVPQVEQ